MQQAVRPNLNRKGTFTTHRIGPRGGVDYAHQQAALSGVVYLQHCTMHIAAARAQGIFAGKQKTPCAAVIGEIVTASAPPDQQPEQIFYNPRINPNAFIDAQQQPIQHAQFVRLEGTKAWAWR